MFTTPTTLEFAIFATGLVLPMADASVLPIGAGGRSRTRDRRIICPLLFQLSYARRLNLSICNPR